MDQRGKLFIAAAAGTLILAGAMTAAAMTPSHTDQKRQHMSALKVSGLEGFRVRDPDGRDVGRVVQVEADAKGRTRYIHATLNGGEDVRIAAFHAQLDKPGQAIDLTVSAAAVVNDPGALISSPTTASMIIASAETAH